MIGLSPLYAQISASGSYQVHKVHMSEDEISCHIHVSSNCIHNSDRLSKSTGKLQINKGMCLYRGAEFRFWLSLKNYGLLQVLVRITDLSYKMFRSVSSVIKGDTL